MAGSGGAGGGPLGPAAPAVCPPSGHKKKATARVAPTTAPPKKGFCEEVPVVGRLLWVYPRQRGMGREVVAGREVSAISEFGGISLAGGTSTHRVTLAPPLQQEACRIPAKSRRSATGREVRAPPVRRSNRRVFICKDLQSSISRISPPGVGAKTVPLLSSDGTNVPFLNMGRPEET